MFLPCGGNFHVDKPHESEDVLHDILANVHGEKEFVEHHRAEILVGKLVLQLNKQKVETFRISMGYLFGRHTGKQTLRKIYLN